MNRNRFDVIIKKNEDDIVLQDASQIGYIPVWFAKASSFVIVRKKNKYVCQLGKTACLMESVQWSRI